jgi:hypothetical protein
MDLTVVVAVHNETVACAPTIEFAERAVEAARAVGVTIQMVIAMNDATDGAREYFHQSAFSRWERWEVHQSDRAKASSALALEASGRYLTFLWADNLISENWLADGVTALKAAGDRGDRVIAHPELSVSFAGGNNLMQSVDQSSMLFAPHYCYVDSCYSSVFVAPREVHLEASLGDLEGAGGLSHEDWRFEVETMAGGWRHVVVADTIVFTRRRDFLAAKSAGPAPLLRSLPQMAIDRIRDLRVSGGG